MPSVRKQITILFFFTKLNYYCLVDLDNNMNARLIRIEQLGKIYQEYLQNNNNDHTLAIQLLDKHLLKTWFYSQSTREDYILAVRTHLGYE